MERSSYTWYLPWSENARRTLGRRLVKAGATRVLVKAGGDGGVLWGEGIPLPSFARPQWGSWGNDLAAAGLEVVPWFYNHPHDSDIEVVLRALDARPAVAVVLNPESEWEGISDVTASAWVDELRTRLELANRPIPIGFTSVASWDGSVQGRVRAKNFPYRGFAEACDFTHPQVYWTPMMLDQVPYLLDRTPTGKPIVPILPATQTEDPGGVREEWTDSKIVALAEHLRAGLGGALAGFSAWVCGRDDYAYDAMSEAYALLPSEPQQQQPFPLIGGFRQFYEATPNALHLFGLPLTPERREVLEDGREYTVQYFERARFEWHPENADPYKVLLGRLGADALARRGA